VPQVKASQCPGCRTMLDGCTVINDPDEEKLPKPGDLTVCMYCGSILRFTDGRMLAICTKEDLEDVEEETMDLLIEVQKKALEMAAKRN